MFNIVNIQNQKGEMREGLKDSLLSKEREWVSENSVRKVSKPSVSPGRVRYLEKNEIKKLLDCTKQSKSKELYAAVVIALGTVCV